MTVYESVVVDSNQVPVPGAQGYVYVDGVLTTALTDDAGLPVQNPVTADSVGYVKFTIPDGSYAIHWWWMGKRRLIETFTQGPQGEQGVTNITYLASGVIFDTTRGDTFASKWTVPADATLTNVNGELIFNSTGTAKNLRMKLKNLAGTGDFKGAYEDDWETDFTIQLLSAFSVADVRAIECGFITDDIRISTNYFGARLGSHPSTAAQVLGYLDNFSGQISTDPAGYTYTVGDTIRLRVKRSGNVISRTMNYNGGADVTTSLTANFTTGNTELPRLLQTPFFNFVRGHYKLTSAKVTIGNTNPALAIAGTSLSQGRYTTPYSQGFAQQIKAAHSSDVAVMGAPSGTSADILGSLPDLLQHYRPKTLLLEPFSNDVLTTVPLATTQANIAAIKALCDTSNVRLLMLNSPPLNSSYATAINDWLAASSYEVFDWYSLLVGTGIALNPLYSNGESGTPDGIHFNEAGADAVVPAIDAWLIGKGVFIATGTSLIIDTDPGMTANSDVRVPTQRAVVSYVAEQSGAVRPEDFGSVTGNALPAFLAAYEYAKANGITRMVLDDYATYDWWAPVVSGTYDPFDVNGSGNFFTISHDFFIDGRFATINCKAYNGGALSSVTQARTAYAVWRGSALNIIGGTIGTNSFGIKGVGARNLTINGGRPRIDTGSRAGDLAQADLTHKGLRIQDTYLGRLDFENVILEDFGGEIWYLGNSTHMPINLVNCEGDGSNQSVLNPNRGGVNVIGGKYGNAPIAIEAVGGTGHTYNGVRFYDAYEATFFGAGMFDLANLGFTASGSRYSYPSNLGSEAELPYIDLDGCVFDNCSSLYAPAYTRGSVIGVDTDLQILYGNYRPWHTQLKFHYIVHKLAKTAAVTIQGPPTLTTAIAGSSPTTYFQPVRHCSVDLSMSRTKYAVDNAITCTESLRVDGHIDQNSCHVRLDESCFQATSTRLARALGTIKGTPKITIGHMACDKSDSYSTGTGSLTLSPTSPIMVITWSGAAAEKAVGFSNPFDTANSYTYAPGQRMRVFYGGGSTAGTVMLFDPATWRLPKPIRLRANSDWIEFEWNPFTLGTGAWHYVAHYIRNEFMSGSATYDAPSVAAGGTTTTTVTVTGAVLGDKVESISFGVSLAGLVATGYVSAADTATVVLYNPTAGAIDLASTTLRVDVAKA